MTDNLPAARVPLYALTSILLALFLSACGNSSSELAGPSETIHVYKANCISCHGSDLQGKMGPSTDLTQVGSRLSKEQITNQIHNGGELMPAFKGKLTAQQIKELAQWLSAKK
ncbi:c-type cytochrome [Paenibacillus solisilvae]|uniref:C-type cytochrome n=1 Tax=Paenibacillus solisilvae TaxID=2486751 RepID=A0ABW0W2N3_9BACL